MNDQVHHLEVGADISERLDKFLVAQLPAYSRARLQSLIKEGLVRVDGELPPKAGFKLEGGEHIEVIVPPAEPSELLPEEIPLNIVFENEDLIVINKAAGMVVHPAAGHRAGTLMHAALAHAPDIEGVGGELRPGLVHRLDKDTSGLILLAKTDRTQRHLQKQFEARQVDKTYLALVDGRPPSATGRIEAPIGRDLRDRKRMSVQPAGRGREAISEFRTVENFATHSLLEVELLTGRTHQIRVHLAFVGCPVAGDRVYGRRNPSLNLERQFLHAARLAIKLPGDRVKHTFEAPLPDDLQRVLDELRVKR